MAFVQNVTPTFVRQPNIGLARLTTGTGSSVAVTVYTGSSNGSKIVGLMATGTSSVAQDLNWGITNGGIFYTIGTVTVSASGAGSSSTIPALNLFNVSNCPGLPYDSDGNPFVFLSSSLDTLTVKSPSVVTGAGAVINVTAISGDF